MGKCPRDALHHAHKAHTHPTALQHMQQPAPGRTPQSLHGGLGEGGTPRLLSWVPLPSTRHASARPSSFPLTSTPPEPRQPLETASRPRLSLLHPPPHQRHSKARANGRVHMGGRMGCTRTWRKNKATQGERREGEKRKRGLHLGRRKRLLVTPIDHRTERPTIHHDRL